MKDRIKQYMDYKNISAGELSALLEVQRSNISHILNGRNKPGALFIEKLLVCFPDLNARWLLTGGGDMILEEKHTEIKKKEENEVVEEAVESETIDKEEPKVQKEEPKEEPVSPKQLEITDKSISKIVLLYDDGTFRDFNRK